ncbi:division/cell wall cluster transcriptional repressor MraZ [Algicola sagamiensis]|uniref:division/cell wall cluster transcriptional repressor MraZ n=1 Tax=Algicola sagamiensis TaxID=163869 RepID=UPI0003A5E990|nr:division/cell wall cluster transcriptional repressor MraZ [Algicola sagamiensis]
MFRGASAINLDAKGRLAIPSRYRQMLAVDTCGSLICTIDLHQPCLLLYPLNEWELIERKLRQLSSMNPHERRIQRLLLGYASEGELDKAGRFLIPAPLRQHAGVDKHIMLVGQLNRFEIWSEAKWQDQINLDIEIEQQGNFELTEKLKDFSL